MNYSQYKKDFENIVEKLDLLSIIEVYEQETSFSLNKNMMGACPFCNSGNHDSTNSDGAFKVYPSTNKAVCHSCGSATGTVKMIMQIHSLDYKAAIHYIAKNYFQIELLNPYEQVVFPEQKRTFNQRTKPTTDELKKEAEERRKRFDYVKSLALDNPQKELAKGYLSGRGIDIEKVDGFYFQHEAYNNMPAGVVFFDSEKQLLNKRYITNNLPEGVGKTFNYGSLKNSVYDNSFIPEQKKLFLTEGVINALSFSSISKSAIALFGTTNIIDDKYKFWKYFYEKDIVISYDFDKAGMRAAVKLADFILNNFKINSLNILLHPDKKDDNDLLQANSLETHLDNSNNYVKISKDYVKIELDKIKADRDYCPNQEYLNYSVIHGEQEFKFKAMKKSETQTNIFAKLKIDSDVCKNLDISLVDFVQYPNNNLTHKFKSTEEFPIFIISNVEGKSIWRPNSQIYNELFHIEVPEKGVYGDAKFKKDNETLRALNDEEKPSKNKKNHQNVFICFNVKDYISITELDKPVFLLVESKINYTLYNDEIKPETWKVTLLPANNAKEQKIAKKIAMSNIDMYTYRTPKEFLNVSDYIRSLDGKDYIFFKQLNTALPVKFWEYEKKDIDLNLIAFLNFLENHGYYSYPDEKDKQGYKYISISGKIVKEFQDKEQFVWTVRTFTNKWLAHRGEQIKIRNKILTSGIFTERNLNQIKQIELDFENSGKDYQNLFFSDGYAWHISNGKITKIHQSTISKYIWNNDLIDGPSKIKKAPFKISYSNEYLKLLAELEKSKGSDEYLNLKFKVKNFSDTLKYDIQILDENNYFLQFAWLTSYIYWKDAEKKGYYLKRNDFWSKLDQYLSKEQIQEMKLHLINKITWIGYFMRDYRSPADDYGLAILDAIDLKNDNLKREAAGGGKSLYGHAFECVKPTYIVKADAEDFTTNKFRYENYKGQKIMVLDDMHKYSRIGDILTDFNLGITVNPKHKQPIEIPIEKSPKIIITRNYIDMEGARVDRRLGRIFVSDFFHDNKGGKYQETRDPRIFFGRNLFKDDTENEKSDLYSFFAYSYIENQKFGEINSPIDELYNYRIIKEVGEELIDFLDVYLDDQNNHGFIDLKFLFDNFKDQFKDSFSGYQKNKLYNTPSNFKKLLKKYCELNNLVFTPEELLNKDGRIVRRSEHRFNKSQERIPAEHVFISTKENFQEKIQDKMPF